MGNNHFKIVDISKKDAYHDIKEHLIGKTGLFPDKHFYKEEAMYRGDFYFDAPIVVKFPGEDKYSTLKSCFFLYVSIIATVDIIPDDFFILGD